jgi:predicted nucleic-acid-binding protein
MIAPDTNVLVRIIVRDDEAQARRAIRSLSDQDGVFISKTVLLETGWVLSRAYRLSRERMLDALRTIIGLPNVEIEDESAVRRAVDWFQRGFDFADALHLASATGARRFLTFDRSLRRRARRLGIDTVAPS